MLPTNVSFYQAVASTREVAICKLLSKIYKSGLRAVVQTKDAAEQEVLNKLLWSFSRSEFIPHASHNDPLPERQPIYITYIEENPNDAKLVIFTTALEPRSITFERIIYIFSDNNQNEIEFAREKYKFYKNLGIKIDYWKQNDVTGGWEVIA